MIPAWDDVLDPALPGNACGAMLLFGQIEAKEAVVE
jgi:hypothetical protein